MFDPNAFLAKTGAGKSIRTYSKNQTVFVQGAPADTVCFIQNGRVKLTVVSSQGKEAIIGFLEAGQFFGESCLSGRSVRFETATAVEDCLITSITKSALLDAIKNYPAFSRLFINHLVERNIRIEDDLVDQFFHSSEKRLARLLLLLANVGNDQNPKPIEFDVSQEALAEMIGTTRSRVSFFMNKFRKLGLVSYNGKIVVHNALLTALLKDTPQME
jgi:CRP-like cAMP-binding protein